MWFSRKASSGRKFGLEVEDRFDILGRMKRSMSVYLIFLLGGVLLTGCGKKDDKPASTSTDNNSSGNPITAPVDYLGAVSKGKTTAVKTADLAVVNQAIKLFQSEEGRFPKDLNELVTEKYLPKIPAAPYGTKYTYDAATGTAGIVKLPQP